MRIREQMLVVEAFDKRHIEHDHTMDEPRPGRHVGHVGQPQLVDAGGDDLALHQVLRWTLEARRSALGTRSSTTALRC